MILKILGRIIDNKYLLAKIHFQLRALYANMIKNNFVRSQIFHRLLLESRPAFLREKLE